MKPVEYFGLAAALFTFSLATTSIQNSLPEGFFRTALTVIAAIAIFAGMVAILLCPPCKQTISDQQRRVVVIIRDCRAQSRNIIVALINCFRGLFSICSRCVGYYLGVMASFLLVFAARKYEFSPALLVDFEAWMLFVIAFILILPTVVHGTLRRNKKSSTQKSMWLLMTSGFLAGLAWFVTYLAFSKIMNS